MASPDTLIQVGFTSEAGAPRWIVWQFHVWQSHDWDVAAFGYRSVLDPGLPLATGAHRVDSLFTTLRHYRDSRLFSTIRTNRFMAVQ